MGAICTATWSSPRPASPSPTSLCKANIVKAKAEATVAGTKRRIKARQEQSQNCTHAETMNHAQYIRQQYSPLL